MIFIKAKLWDWETKTHANEKPHFRLANHGFSEPNNFSQSLTSAMSVPNVVEGLLSDGESYPN